MVLSLIGLTLVLALMMLLVLLAAIGLRPGDSGSLGPVPTPPHFEAAVGDSAPLGSARAPRVARAVAATGAGVAVAANSVVSASPMTGAERRDGAGPAVAPAQAVAVVAPAPSGPQPPQPTAQPVTAPTPEAAPAPTIVTAPVPAAVGGGGGQGGPVAAGGPVIESCEGDEYVITIVFAPEAAGEEQSVEIVLTKFNEDGSFEELRLEGGLLDAQSLALQLSSEGNCVRIEDGTPSGGTSPVVVPAEGVPSSVVDSLKAPPAPDSP